MSDRTYTCGHSAAEPVHMGRGQARVKRLTKYFGRPCIICARQHAIARAHQLTDMRANPLVGAALDAAVAHGI